MLRIGRPVASAFVVASSIVTSLVPAVARAQTVTPLNNGVTYRLDSNGNDVTSQERPQNQNPTGISFNDCITNMSLGFPIALTGFAGQGLEVWAGTQDCTTDMSRGKMGTTAVCWKVAELGAMNVQTTNSTQINVRMQNIVGPQSTTPTQTLVNETSSACYSQQSYASVQFNVAFVPVTSAGLLPPGGMGASFSVNTDLVGPPAPTGIGDSTGDTLFIVNWTPNVDPDTAGYDVYIAPTSQLSSSTITDGGMSDSGLPDSGYTRVCSSGGSSGSSGSSGGSGSSSGGADAASDGADDSAILDGATADVTVADSSSSGSSSSSSSSSGSSTPTCYLQATPPPPGCGGSVFSQSSTTDGGGSVTVTTTDDAGDEASTTINATGGGISQIPTQYLVNANGTTSVTVSSASVGSYTVSGLNNKLQYVAVVSAVDGFGNIGPPSTQVCASPAPVKDFYKEYRVDGGNAGGGFCTLEAVGAPRGASIVSVGFAALAFGLGRRRRRRGA